MLLEPQHALRVEVVGRLVEQEQVGLAQQELAQRDPAALATGQVDDRSVRRRAAQRVHRLLELGVDLPRVGVVQDLLQLAELLHELVGVVGGHLLGDRVVPVELRLDLAEPLLDVARGPSSPRSAAAPAGGSRPSPPAAGRPRRCSACSSPAMIFRTVDLPGAVRPDDTDLGSRQEVQRHVIEDDLVTVGLPDLLHGVDELRHVSDGSCAALSPRRPVRRPPAQLVPSRVVRRRRRRCRSPVVLASRWPAAPVALEHDRAPGQVRGDVLRLDRHGRTAAGPRARSCG